MLITLARKPLTGSVAANCLAHGVGGINIDATRIAGVLPTPCFGTGWSWHDKNNALLGYRDKEYYADQAGAAYTPSQLGRWPANVLHDGSEAVLAGFPQTEGGKFKLNRDTGRTAISTTAHNARQPNRPSSICNYGDAGGASRFFKQVQRQPDGFPSQDKQVGGGNGQA